MENPIQTDRQIRKKTSRLVDNTFKKLTKADNEAMKHIPKDLPKKGCKY